MSTDAIVLVKNDHKEIRRLFREFEHPSALKKTVGAVLS
jgi:hypothetical protein